jgi:hypothetical protein
VTIRVFEIVDTSKNAMVLQVNDVLAKHGLNAHVFAYVKDELSNLSTMTSTLTSILSCKVLGLLAPFVESCCGHAMSKCCQYSTNDSKVQFQSRRHNPYCKILSLGLRRVVRDKKNGIKHAWM